MKALVFACYVLGIKSQSSDEVGTHAHSCATHPRRLHKHIDEAYHPLSPRRTYTISLGSVERGSRGSAPQFFHALPLARPPRSKTAHLDIGRPQLTHVNDGDVEQFKNGPKSAPEA